MDEMFSRIMVGFSKLLEDSLKEVATKSDLGHLGNLIKKIAVENDFLRASVDRLKKENADLRYQIEEVDRKSRKNNLILKGLPAGNENLMHTSTKILRELVVGKEIGIDRATRLGRGNAPVLIEMTDNHVVPEILKNAGKLIKTGVSISKDLTPLMRSKANRMLKLRWELRNRFPNANLSMKLHDDTLKIDGKTIACIEDELKCDGEDALLVLNKMFDADVGDILARVKNFVVLPPKKQNPKNDDSTVK
ncbi:Hypothetical protein NTJ_16272 [Nesidiocoris tenuis]|uniref:Uncharacterized protein n=1 Tax=Nesidiocoris tenuis TaxID=355587 RepID=A0ABN7BGH4_9HEMI|nr:Hypothetical protein NTJ_16272 [Nesidiocoris tenuis]